jgi:FAD/FMN-containing dehydrogenase
VGLSIDTLLSADVVLANGRQVTASDYHNGDLFWALRGGSGNFGVVIGFEFRLHEVGDVVGGPLFYDFDDATAVLKCYRSFLKEAPEQLGCFFGWQIAPPLAFIPADRVGDPVCVLVVCGNGPHAEAEQVLRPLREVAEVKAGRVGVMPFPALPSAFDDLVPKGMQNHRKTAFGHRDKRFAPVIVGIWPGPADDEVDTTWVRDDHTAIHPHGGGAGGYVNFVSGDDAHRAAENDGAHHERLCAVKAAYDPDNIFHVNQNIAPARRR